MEHGQWDEKCQRAGKTDRARTQDHPVDRRISTDLTRSYEGWCENKCQRRETMQPGVRDVEQRTQRARGFET